MSAQLFHHEPLVMVSVAACWVDKERSRCARGGGLLGRGVPIRGLQTPADADSNYK